jgi:hypothetical protein
MVQAFLGELRHAHGSLLSYQVFCWFLLPHGMIGIRNLVGHLGQQGTWRDKGTKLFPPLPE